MNQFMSPETFVSGGLFLVIAGFLFNYLRQLPGKIFRIIERQFMVSLHIYDSDESFYWVKLWMGKKLEKAKSVTTFTKRFVDYNNIRYENDILEEKYKNITDSNNVDNRPQATIIPAPGFYWFWYKKRFCWVYYSREIEQGTGNTTTKPREQFSIKFFSSNLSLVVELLNEAREVALPKDGKVEIRSSKGYQFDLIGRVDKRPLDSVILQNNIVENIVNDIKKFQSNRDWYINMGIPYRRGFLLYGPPGGGKSSLVLALASHLGMNVNILFLSDPHMNDSNLLDSINQTDSNTILLIEDIDAVFRKRKSTNDTKGTGLTFSGLLNALDGVAASGGRVLFMTTNKVSEIDPALIRPGRADLRIYVPFATTEQLERIFYRFFPESKDLCKKFASLIESGTLSMASVQGHLLKYKEDAISAIENIKELIEENKKIKSE